MLVQAYECPRTGTLFKTQAEFAAHVAKFEKVDALAQLRAKLAPELERLQRSPFVEATSVKDFVSRMVEVYPEITSMMERCELLPVPFKDNMLLSLEVEESSLMSRQGDLTLWEPKFGALEDSAEALNGLNFELCIKARFEKPIGSAYENYLNDVFPQLNSYLHNTSEDETANVIWAYPFIAHMPVLLEKHRTLRGISIDKDAYSSLKTLETQYLADDVEHKKLIDEQAQVKLEIEALTAKLVDLRLKDCARIAAAYAAASEHYPQFALAESLRQDLQVS